MYIEVKFLVEKLYNSLACTLSHPHIYILILYSLLDDSALDFIREFKYAFGHDIKNDISSNLLKLITRNIFLPLYS